MSYYSRDPHPVVGLNQKTGPASDGGHRLRRELRLRDLIFMQLILVLGFSTIGFAAKQGSTHLILWLVAIIVFYIPLAAVVIRLSRFIATEGGIYQWVKYGFSPLAGYIAAWNLTAYAIAVFATSGSVLANGLAYSGGLSTQWMADNKGVTLSLTVLTCAITYVINVRGLRATKWLNGGSSVLMVAIYVVLVLLLFKALIVLRMPANGAASLAWPSLTLGSLNVLSKMSVGALSGFDQSAVFSEECQRPDTDIARSVFIAAPLIAILYILGTMAILVYNPPSAVDLAAPIQQVIQTGFGASYTGKVMTAAVVITTNIAYVAGVVVAVGMVARLPMVAGWDGLLPEWWSKLHPKYGSPSRAIGAVVVSLMLLGVLSVIGASNQEAVQVGISVGIASLCVMYILLFGTVLFGFRSTMPPKGLGITMCAIAGFAVSLVALVFEVIPLGAVADVPLFGMKVAGALICTNLFGMLLYRRGLRRKRRAMEMGAM